jgi:1-acyl-sn-glycerol-3-phosphate acyltransferase
MITRKHYNNAKMRWIYDAMRLIPVNIDGFDSIALKESIKGLREGDVLGVFPEGTRSKDGKLKENVHSGAAYLAVKSGVNVLPIGIAGSFEVLSPGTSEFFPHPVTVNIGKPLIPPGKLSKKNVDLFMDEILDNIRELMQIAD